MTKFIAFLTALIVSLGIYSAVGTVTEVNYEEDTVTFTNCNGHSWSFYGTEDWCLNDIVSAVMWNGGTPGNCKDDVILWTRYAGIVEWLPHVDE